MHMLGYHPSTHLPSAPLGGARYDAGLIYLIPAVAIGMTLVVLFAPHLIWPVLLADLWLLGYHHVVATYTRTSLDREAFRRYWKLNLLLPPTVLAVVLLIGKVGGAVALTTIYIHWQLYHYVRQSEGISKAFASRQSDRGLPHQPSVRVAFYLVPAAAFLTMASQSSGRFLTFPVWLPILPWPALLALWLAALVAMARALQACRRSAHTGALSRQYAHYLISHFTIFIAAYGLIADVTLSWLMANIWHNCQYLMFVWKANQQRFRGEVHLRATFLSTVCRPNNLWLYLAACMALTLAIYFGLESIAGWFGTTLRLQPIVAAAVLYQTINFHHYIVDAIIWRRPAPAAPACTQSA